ncbi:hypothetical protein [Legionella fallonii]|uniref:Uncharacterized protein n=1 Tax=Legionella fallonii LLAP-10 TaxID=1212491 RepID=A0A098G0M2_9GAMM|nr:hypothetical protein [Legionella fallonii]CEG56062.1 conserved protein of unknown function [Legionella fallonii LLAP-10]
MLDQDAYEQISRVFDEWERARLQQPNPGPQLTLDYDDVLIDVEKLSAKEEDSRGLNQTHNTMGANLYDWHINCGVVGVVHAENLYSETRQKSSSMVVNQSNNPPGANFYSWARNSDAVRVESSEERYSKHSKAAGVQKTSQKKSSKLVSQSKGTEGGKLYFWNMKSNKILVASTESLYPRVKQFTKKWELLASEPIPENSTSTSQMMTGTADLNKGSTATGASSGMFDQRPTNSRTNPSDNQEGNESTSSFSSSL